MSNPFLGARPTDVNRFSEFTNLWIARYPSVRLWRDQRLFGRHDTQSDGLAVLSATAMATSSVRLAAEKHTAQMPNLVLVVVESWGLETDSSIRNFLVGPYFQPNLRARYEILQGTVPFYGSTVSGEVRELCGNKLGTHVMYASKQDLQDCLPGQLISLGYHNIAAHGMDGEMFNRLTWYSNVGFQEQWFRDQFRQQGLPDCPGAFVGTCDAAIAAWIGRRLGRKNPDPDFVYWMTLNSHLPVLVPSPLPVGASCSLTPLLSHRPTLCSWYQLVFNVHDSVSRLAMTSLTRPTVFVVVGDHAPPFADRELRAQFSGEVVPYIILLPRGAATAE